MCFVRWGALLGSTDNYVPRDYYAFRSSLRERIQQAEREAYHINAYRVLLTRARQGMVIVVPHGASDDHRRQPGFNDI